MKKNMTNEINIQGYVFNFSGNGLFHGTTGPESKVPNTDYVSGTVNIATDEEGANVVPVRFNFITKKYSKSGKENPNWQVLKDIEDGNKTWEQQGKDGAYKIRVACMAGSNPFVGQDGKMVDRPSIDVNFAHPSNNGFNENQRNSFKFDMVVVNYFVKEVEDDDDYGILNGYTFNSFRKEAIPLTLVVRMPEAMSYFENLDASTANPVFQTVWGNIVSTTIRKEQEVESAFGKPQITYTTSTQREWVVTGASANPGEFGDESILTEDELIECLNNHESVVAAAQKRYDDKQNGGTAFSEKKTTKRTFGSASDFGF